MEPEETAYAITHEEITKLIQRAGEWDPNDVVLSGRLIQDMKAALEILARERAKYTRQGVRRALPGSTILSGFLVRRHQLSRPEHLGAHPGERA